MPINVNSPVPYAPAAPVVNVYTRFRERGLGTPITTDVLMRAGVTESLANRTMQSLQGLDLVDEEGQPTEWLNKIRTAPTSELKAVLAEWIKAVYAEVFQFVDPSKDDQVAIRDAFRSYQPIGQQDRAVALFIALCVEAGLAPESMKNAPKAPVRRPAGSARAAPAPKPTPKVKSYGGGAAQPVGELPPAITGLLASLPSNGTGWTKDQRDRFLKTFESVLDFVIPVRTAASNVADLIGDEDEAT